MGRAKQGDLRGGKLNPVAFSISETTGANLEKIMDILNIGRYSE